MPQSLRSLITLLNNFFGANLNSVLCNMYLCGANSINWHSDDEPELGENPLIVSISLGGARQFSLRQKASHSTQRHIVLPHGSLLYMSGETQSQWQHAVLPCQSSDARINLTMREVKA